MELANEVALVTGAARGIGRAIAERLAASGADVALADLSQDLLAQSADAVERCGSRALALGVDVSRKPDVESMVQRVLERFGRIDMLINNAGVIEIQGFLDVDEKTWDRIMAVNAKGVFLCGQAVARQMVSQGGGRIVNIASLAARIGIADMAVYAASKAAVMSLTRSMALALAPHDVRVNALAPGIVDTDMWTLIDERRAALGGLAPGEPIRRRLSSVPLGRAATPADVAAVAAFLVGDDARYLTGQTINVDGGTLPS